MMSSSELSLEKIGGQFYLLCFDKLSDITYELLSCLVKNDSDKNEIISFTIAPGEISLIISKEFYLQEFQHIELGGGLRGKTGTYDLIAVSTGRNSLLETGILSSITNIFYEYGIPVFCLSTYLMNYLLIPSINKEKVNKMTESVKWITWIGFKE